MLRHAATVLFGFALLASCYAAARADDGSEMVGVYAGTSSAGGFQEIWQIKMENGGLTVTGLFRKNNQDVGLFQGKNVKYDNGTLSFEQAYVKKPDPKWADGTEITASVSGDKLNFTWKNGGQSGKNTLDRLPTADRFVGTWEGMSGAGGFQEIWQIKIDKNTMTVVGIFRKDGKDVGMFTGKNVVFLNGVVTFTQQYQQKPDPSWSDGNQMTAKVNGNKLEFTWKNGGQSGNGSLDRAKQ